MVDLIKFSLVKERGFRIGGVGFISRFISKVWFLLLYCFSEVEFS